jgi:hypothetical protein
MIENAARSRFPTAESVIPKVPENAPSPQSTYMHLPAININQYLGYSSHNPPSLHSSQYRITVTGDNFPLFGSLQMYVHHPLLRVAISLTSIQASFAAPHTQHRSCAPQLLPQIIHS